jgi:hypothetical protein
LVGEVIEVSDLLLHLFYSPKGKTMTYRISQSTRVRKKKRSVRSLTSMTSLTSLTSLTTTDTVDRLMPNELGQA